MHFDNVAFLRYALNERDGNGSGHCSAWNGPDEVKERVTGNERVRHSERAIVQREIGRERE